MPHLASKKNQNKTGSLYSLAFSFPYQSNPWLYLASRVLRLLGTCGGMETTNPWQCPGEETDSFFQNI